ncbi:MAG: STAS domain-containing protein [Chitinivibrionales bacterium]
MTVNTAKKEGVPVVELSGRVHSSESPIMKRKLENAYRKKDECIVVDITEVEFVDSQGLGIIVYYHTLLQKSGRRLVILNSSSDPDSYVTKLFNITNLDKVLNVVGSFQEIFKEI